MLIETLNAYGTYELVDTNTNRVVEVRPSYYWFDASSGGLVCAVTSFILYWQEMAEWTGNTELAEAAKEIQEKAGYANW